MWSGMRCELSCGFRVSSCALQRSQMTDYRSQITELEVRLQMTEVRCQITEFRIISEADCGRQLSGVRCQESGVREARGETTENRNMIMEFRIKICSGPWTVDRGLSTSTPL